MKLITLNLEIISSAFVVLPHRKWVLESGREYDIYIEIYDTDSHKIYPSDVSSSLTAVFFYFNLITYTFNKILLIYISSVYLKILSSIKKLKILDKTEWLEQDIWLVSFIRLGRSV